MCVCVRGVLCVGRVDVADGMVLDSDGGCWLVGVASVCFYYCAFCEYLYIDNTSGRWSGRSGGKAGSKQRRFSLPEVSCE